MSDKGPRIRKIPPGDQHERLVCPECDFVAYENPKIVNVSVATYKGKVLLCRRAIEPGRGLWTIPGGYMENGETVKEGALREAFEEAGAGIKVGPLLAIYHTSSKKVVIMVFRAEMSSPRLNIGPESLEARLFDWKDIPWNSLAFPMDHEALKRYDQTKHLTDFQPLIGVLPPLPERPAPPVQKPPKNGPQP